MQIEGVTITAADVERLRCALSIALKPNDVTIPILINTLRSGDMPPYQNDWVYDGERDQNSVADPPRSLKPGEKVFVISINQALYQNRNDTASKSPPACKRAHGLG